MSVVNFRPSSTLLSKQHGVDKVLPRPARIRVRKQLGCLSEVASVQPDSEHLVVAGEGLELSTPGVNDAGGSI